MRFLLIPWFKLDGWHIPGLPESFAIQPFGLLVAIGVLLGIRRTERHAARCGLRSAMIALFFALDRKPRPHGFFVAVIGLCYAPFRFGLDFLREADATYFGLTPAQYACIPTFGFCGYLLWRFYKRPIGAIPPAMSAAL